MRPSRAIPLILCPTDVVEVSKCIEKGAYDEGANILRNRWSLLAHDHSSSVTLFGPSWPNSHFMAITFDYLTSATVYNWGTLLSSTYVQNWQRIIYAALPETGYENFYYGYGNASIPHAERWTSLQKSLASAAVVPDVLLNDHNGLHFPDRDDVIGEVKREIRQELVNLLGRKKRGMLGIESLPKVPIYFEAKELTRENLTVVPEF